MDHSSSKTGAIYVQMFGRAKRNKDAVWRRYAAPRDSYRIGFKPTKPKSLFARLLAHLWAML